MGNLTDKAVSGVGNWPLPRTILARAAGTFNALIFKSSNARAFTGRGGGGRLSGDVEVSI